MVHDVSFAVARGGILGPNGAGLLQRRLEVTFDSVEGLHHLHALAERDVDLSLLLRRQRGRASAATSARSWAPCRRSAYGAP